MQIFVNELTYAKIVNQLANFGDENGLTKNKNLPDGLYIQNVEVIFDLV